MALPGDGRPRAYGADRVFDGEHLRPEGSLVLVRDGRVVGVEPPGAEVPAEFELIERRGTTLLPGLIDGHVHLCADGEPDAFDIAAARTPAERETVVRRSLHRQLAAGVTTVRDLGDDRYAVVDRPAGVGEPTVGQWHTSSSRSPHPSRVAKLQPLLLGAVHAAVESTPGANCSCVVSVARPVDRRTGQLVQVPHAPFLVGEFAPKEVLHHIAPVIEVDNNNVNWAALAEHQPGNATDLDDFALYYLGAGIGGAIMTGGSLVAAHTAWPASWPTSGPGDRLTGVSPWLSVSPPGTSCYPGRTRSTFRESATSSRGSRQPIGTDATRLLLLWRALLSPSLPRSTPETS
jgi:hypothetical protein